MDIAAAVKQGMSLLESREFARAEKIFSDALARDTHPSIRNNLALAQVNQGKHRDALKTLEPVLGLPMPNPVARSLAAQCVWVAGKTAQAEMYIRQAIRDYEIGMKNIRSSPMPDVWRSYGVFIFRALGRIGDAERICTLAERWRKYQLPREAVWLSGAAHFNLRRYKRAGVIWGKMPDATSSHKVVADLIDQGVIPPFSVEYAGPQEPKSDTDFGAYVGTGSGKIMLLGLAFGLAPEGEAAEMAIDLLITHGGKWGESFARKLLMSPVVSQERKMGALTALAREGIIADGEGIQVWLDGEIRTVQVNTDTELGDKMEAAEGLAREGKYGEAITILESLTSHGFHASVYIDLIQCLLNSNRDEEAAEPLQVLKNNCPQRAITHYLEAMYFLKRKEIAAAERALARAKGKQGYEVIKESAKRLAMYLAMGRTMKRLASPKSKNSGLDKILPVDPTLVQGFNNLPVEALRTAYGHWQLGGETIRSAIQKRLVQQLKTSESLTECWRSLQPREKELVAFLLAKGGWARLHVVTRKYGNLPEDIDFSKLPTGSLARLWTLGLVFVGTALIDGRRTKIATVSVEVREMISAILGVK